MLKKNSTRMGASFGDGGLTSQGRSTDPPTTAWTVVRGPEADKDNGCHGNEFLGYFLHTSSHNEYLQNNILFHSKYLLSSI